MCFTSLSVFPFAFHRRELRKLCCLGSSIAAKPHAGLAASPLAWLKENRGFPKLQTVEIASFRNPDVKTQRKTTSIAEYNAISTNFENRDFAASSKTKESNENRKNKNKFLIFRKIMVLLLLRPLGDAHKEKTQQ